MLAQLYLFGEDEASCVSKISCRNIIFTQHIEKPCTKPLQYIHLNEKFGGGQRNSLHALYAFSKYEFYNLSVEILTVPKIAKVITTFKRQ